MMNFILEKEFVPAIDSFNEFEESASKEITLTIKRGEEIIFPFKMKISDDFALSYFFVKKIILTLFWMVGGEKLLFKGDHSFFLYLKKEMENDLEVQNTLEEISNIFGKKVQLEETSLDYKKKDQISVFSCSFSGNRIGIDLGGSDRKVTAVSNNEVVFSTETLWSPKKEKDPSYHMKGILDSINKAKEHLPSIDAIGFSTAGVVLDNELAFAALYASTSKEDKEKYARYVFKDIMKEHFPNVPFVVENDGDISAIGASFIFNKNYVLGLALGTSFAAGYSANKSLMNWINELSKTPINFSPLARKHYIFGIEGAASEYLSQKGLILLLEKNGLKLEGDLPQKLLKIQELAKENNQLVLDAYHDMGIYLGASIRFYSLFYRIESVLLLGRVLSGKGGEVIKSVAKEYLNSFNMNIDVFSGDESFKRLGQSYVAASLPIIK